MARQSRNGEPLGFEDTLWKAADKLRGSMDASEYKHVILGLIFLGRLGRCSHRGAGSGNWREGGDVGLVDMGRSRRGSGSAGTGTDPSWHAGARRPGW